VLATATDVHARMRLPLIVCLGSLVALASAAARAEAPAERHATIFYTGAVQGAVEPCG